MQLHLLSIINLCYYLSVVILQPPVALEPSQSMPNWPIVNLIHFAISSEHSVDRCRLTLTHFL